MLPARAVVTAPPDAIFGLNETFAADPRAEKVTVVEGVYVDERGEAPVLDSVREAERRLADETTNKMYLPMVGSPTFRSSASRFVFGPSSTIPDTGRVAVAQAPGGTGALRVAADFLFQTGGARTAWVPQPTWPNHPQVFRLAGFHIEPYPYLDKTGYNIDREGLLATLSSAAAGDLVVIHACCHNPTGMDLSIELWHEIADVIVARQLFPVVDFAYQGFGRGIREDAEWLTAFDRPDLEFAICSSFSKNFSLYNERVGAVSVVCVDSDRADAVLSNLKIAIRANYSNPPTHGSSIVSTILGDPALKVQWERELAYMRGRIQSNRASLVDALREQRVAGDWSRIGEQRGLFAYLALSDEQVTRLREDWAIYMVGGGRINVAAVTPGNAGRIAEAVGAVVGR
jgi:aspartate/tyrosine/aromatic aminotransferase